MLKYYAATVSKVEALLHTNSWDKDVKTMLDQIAPSVRVDDEKHCISLNILKYYRFSRMVLLIWKEDFTKFTVSCFSWLKLNVQKHRKWISTIPVGKIDTKRGHSLDIDKNAYPVDDTDSVDEYEQSDSDDEG